MFSFAKRMGFSLSQFEYVLHLTISLHTLKSQWA